MMQVITLPNNEKFVIDDYDNNRDIENVIADFCGEDFARLVMDNIHELECMADYEELKFNSDMGAYEGENEDFRGKLQDIDMLLKQFESNVFDRGILIGTILTAKLQNLQGVTIVHIFVIMTILYRSGS